MVTQLNFLHLRLKFLVPEKNWRHIKKCFCNSLLNCDNESFQSMRLKTDFVTYLKLKASAKNVFALRALPHPPPIDWYPSCTSPNSHWCNGLPHLPDQFQTEDDSPTSAPAHKEVDDITGVHVVSFQTTWKFNLDNFWIRKQN